MSADMAFKASRNGVVLLVDSMVHGTEVNIFEHDGLVKETRLITCMSERQNKVDQNFLSFF